MLRLSHLVLENNSHYVVGVFSYFFLFILERNQYACSMKFRESYKFQYYGSIVILCLIVCWLVAQYFWVFGPHRSFVWGNKNYLEQQRQISVWALETIPGTLLIWPYRSLRTQRYQFIGQPEQFSFRLYNFTFDDTKRWLHELAIKWTKIKGIMESEQYAAKDNQIANLMDWFADNHNITIIPDDRLGISFQHAKTFLIEKWFIIQTANMTFSSFSKNREVFFMSTHTWVLASLQQLFDRDWQWLPTAADSLHPNLVVCPINCRSRIESLLQSAQASIVMYQQYIADNDIQKILSEKQKEWIAMKIILGDMGKKNSSSNNEKNTDEKFYDSLGNMLQKQANPYVHAKAILVDDQFLLIGSMNMSDMSLDKNREIGILLMNKAQIDTFKKTFLKDWEKGKNY